MRRRTPLRLVALILALLLLPAGQALAAPAGSSAAGGPSVSQDHPALQEALDAIVAAGAPGVAAYVRGPDGAWQGASGLADLRSGRPMDAGLHFRVASITKPFVAVVVLQLVEEGRLELTDTVEQWLPGLVPGGEHVTVRQLLQHTSGIADYIWPVVVAFWQSRQNQLRNWDPEELVAIATDQPPLFPPGEAWAYSNTGYLVAGMIIEEVTGNRLDAELSRRVLRPLQLRSTSLPRNSAGFAGPFARGYSQPIDEQLQPIGDVQDIALYNPSLAGAAGAMVSDAADLARFQRALLEGELLGPAMLAEMRATVPTGGPGRDYGLGLMELDLPCGTAVGHTGGLMGYLSLAFSTEGAQRQAVFLVNSDELDVLEPLIAAVLLALCGDVEGPTPPPTPAAAEAPDLARLLGPGLR